MTYNVRQSGAWVAKNTLSVKQSGSMVAKSVAYKRVSGAWVNFLTTLVTLTSRTISETYTPSTASAYLSLEAGGVARELRSSVPGGTAIPGEWLNSGSASSYQMRCTQLSGATITSNTGNSLSTWYTLGSADINFGIVNGSVGTTVTASGLFEIRDASSLIVLASATINFSVTR